MQLLQSFPIACRSTALMLSMVSLVSRAASAQIVPQAPVGQASRADLEARATWLQGVAHADTTKADARKGVQTQLDRLRQRLDEGDFAPGDRVYLRIRGDTAFEGDTLIVRPGPVLEIGQYGVLQLKGVLRSELHDRVVGQVGRLLRQPDVDVASFVRVGVFGQVVRPGYYSVSPEVPVGDALMIAGGPGPDADIEKVELKRDAALLIGAPTMRQAMARGITLDQLDVRPGDAINVGERKHGNFSLIIQTAAVIVGSVTAVLALSRR